MFNANELRNQHYVPAFWQRRFAGADGKLWALRDESIEVVAADNVMSEDWLYTIFDEKWVASNVLEKVAGRRETEAAGILRSLDAPNATGTLGDQITLRYFFAFSACRHPDTMSAGHRRGKEMAFLFADIPSLTVEQFCEGCQKFGLSATDAAIVYSSLQHVPADDLLAQAEQVEKMSPQSPILPQQLAVDLETIVRVFFLLSTLTITIIEAPTGHDFLLGDTPFPPNLASGFTLPISSRLALACQPGGTERFPEWTRRSATPSEVASVNRQQVENALQVVVGPSKASLQPYLAAST